VQEFQGQIHHSAAKYFAAAGLTMLLSWIPKARLLSRSLGPVWESKEQQDFGSYFAPPGGGRRRLIRPGLETFTVLTTEPNALCAPIHNCMPVILAPEDWPKWPAAPDDRTALLRSLSADDMECSPLGKAVGNVGNDDVLLIELFAPLNRRIGGELFRLHPCLFERIMHVEQRAYVKRLLGNTQQNYPESAFREARPCRIGILGVAAYWRKGVI
jgi:SOS response associated peptidase (SRAP)